MDKKDLEQQASHNSVANKQKILDLNARHDEVKDEQEQEYVFIYWDEWR